MASSGKTTNLQLNQWVGSDKPKMSDFNADNLKIEQAVSTHIADTQKHLQDSERTAWNQSIPVIGSYTGNGLAARDIELGFKPSFGILFAVGQNIVQAIGSTGNMQVFSAFVSEQGSSQGVVMTDTGFQVLYNVNAVSNRLALTNVSDQVYVYIMFR